ncbi:putative SNAP25 homologous protein SNAP30 [Brassica rapa]|uniref:putative SNAP25 homologous protein SNAP30 n=1 Tax=Brassica campestris TaxID=3711 RepID=UPI0004F18EA6|nr:putative SNAP25 homologous protein SNAP30 [Brassica rapa]
MLNDKQQATSYMHATPKEDISSNINRRRSARETRFGCARTIEQPTATVRRPTNKRFSESQAREGKARVQDDGLSDLSDILGDLKGMAIDTGSELDKQNKALDHLDHDIDELNSRVKGANQRAYQLLSK